MEVCTYLFILHAVVHRSIRIVVVMLKVANSGASYCGHHQNSFSFQRYSFVCLEMLLIVAVVYQTFWWRRSKNVIKKVKKCKLLMVVIKRAWCFREASNNCKKLSETCVRWSLSVCLAALSHIWWRKWKTFISLYYVGLQKVSLCQRFHMLSCHVKLITWFFFFEQLSDICGRATPMIHISVWISKR